MWNEVTIYDSASGITVVIVKNKHTKNYHPTWASRLRLAHVLHNLSFRVRFMPDWYGRNGQCIVHTMRWQA